MEDDGMGYGVNCNYIQSASCFEDSDGQKYINIFTRRKPTESYKKVLLDRWNEEEKQLEIALKKAGQ